MRGCVFSRLTLTQNRLLGELEDLLKVRLPCECKRGSRVPMRMCCCVAAAVHFNCERRFCLGCRLIRSWLRRLIDRMRVLNLLCIALSQDEEAEVRSEALKALVKLIDFLPPKIRKSKVPFLCPWFFRYAIPIPAWSVLAAFALRCA